MKKKHSGLQNMPDGFCTVDRNWIITFMNDKVGSKAWGIKTSEYIGKNLWDCFPELASSKFFSEYHRALKENTFVSVEDYYPSLDKWFEANIYPYEKGLCFFIKEITVRKKYQEKLEFIAKAAAEVIWERNINSEEIVIDGGKCKELFGYEIKDNTFPFVSWMEKIHPEDLHTIEENRKYAFDNNLEFFLNEYRFKKADGNWAWLKNRIYLVKDNDGKVISLMGLIEDVTSKRVSDIALTESELSYRQLFDNSPLPTIIAHQNSMQVLDANTATSEQYGYSKPELLSMTLPDFLPKDQHEKLMIQRDKVKTGIRNDLGTIYHVRKNGEIILVEISVTPINYKGQQAVLATAKDITERERFRQTILDQKVNYQKRITKAIIDTQDNERNEIGKELHDNVSQILATTKLYVESIKHLPDQKDSLVNKSIQLLSESINEIRRLSHELVTPVISDSGFKNSLLELIDNYNRLKTFNVSHQFDFDDVVLDKSIKLTIYRILQEQFHNTMKHARASIVQVDIKSMKNSIQLTYKDNGIGFNPGKAIKGIGLKNITNRLKAINGKVKLRSSVGNGYEMKIVFPIEKKQQARKD